MCRHRAIKIQRMILALIRIFAGSPGNTVSAVTGKQMIAEEDHDSNWIQSVGYQAVSVMGVLA